MTSTVARAEVARFDALAARWWDTRGPMRALHRMNPARIGWIGEQIAHAFDDTRGLRVLDVGCGGGIAAEALARRGFDVLGLDAAPAAIAAAEAHAAVTQTATPGLRLAYRVGSPEDLLAEGIRFPVVTALEVIEHVPDPDHFVATLTALLDPGGVLILSTLNRTALSFLGAKIGAEYVLRWLPVGTHDWRKFMTPAELGAALRRAGLRVSDLAGLNLDPLTGIWRAGGTLTVNYVIAASAQGQPARLALGKPVAGV